MITELTVCARHARRTGECAHVSFVPGLNVLIGPNQCGKSTLLRAILDCQTCVKKEEGPTRYRFYDLGSLDPHAPPSPEQVRAGGLDPKLASVARSRALFSSHGEIMRTIFGAFQFNATDTLLIDEPEYGQDVEWAQKIRSGMDEMLGLGVQIILASHHPVFWQGARRIELTPGYADKVGMIYKAFLL